MSNDITLNRPSRKCCCGSNIGVRLTLVLIDLRYFGWQFYDMKFLHSENLTLAWIRIHCKSDWSWPWRGPYIMAGIFSRMNLCCKSCTNWSNCNEIGSISSVLSQTLILAASQWTFFKTVFQVFGIGVTTPQQLIYVLL